MDELQTKHACRKPLGLTWCWVSGRLQGRGAGPAGPHYKTGRGRGGEWEDILWDDIYGDNVMNAISFSGGNYIGER
jgi:hypothetical protein